MLITIFGPISGAHFNPAVTLVFAVAARARLARRRRLCRGQLAGGILGVWAAHLMFDLPMLQISVKARTGLGQWLGESIATFGLVLTILGTVRHRPDAVPASVALYITAAYWFTSSTSFANPAVTIARSLSDTFAGIAPPTCRRSSPPSSSARRWRPCSHDFSLTRQGDPPRNEIESRGASTSGESCACCTPHLLSAGRRL